jgi:hypothetical protein
MVGWRGWLTVQSVPARLTALRLKMKCVPTFSVCHVRVLPLVWRPGAPLRRSRHEARKVDHPIPRSLHIAGSDPSPTRSLLRDLLEAAYWTAAMAAAVHLINLPAMAGEKRGRSYSTIDHGPKTRPPSPHGQVQLADVQPEGLQSTCLGAPITAGTGIGVCKTACLAPGTHCFGVTH